REGAAREGIDIQRHGLACANRGRGVFGYIGAQTQWIDLNQCDDGAVDRKICPPRCFLLFDCSTVRGSYDCVTHRFLRQSQRSSLLLDNGEWLIDSVDGGLVTSLGEIVLRDCLIVI